MPEIKVKIPRRERGFFIQKSDVNVEGRRITLSFSSETEEVIRFAPGIGDYVEILDHSPNSVDLRRLKKGGPLLVDHNPKDQVGTIEEVTVGADRMGRAVVRYGRSARASEIFQDVVDEIRTNTSCSYDVLDMRPEGRKKDGIDVYRVTRWMPYEISHVSIPADIDVGVGRGQDQDGREIVIDIPEVPEEKREAAPPVPVNPQPKTEVRVMEKCTICGGDMVDGKCTGARHAEVEQARSKESTRTVQQMEEERKKAIGQICQANHLGENYREHWIGSGASLANVADDVIRILEERGKTNPQPLTRLGLTEPETQRFSLNKAILACATNDWKDAGFELEASRAIAQKLGTSPDPKKFYIPYEVQQRQYNMRDVRNMRASMGMRDLSVGAGGGDYLVQTNNLGFTEMLYNRSVVMQMGARRLSGLVGSVAIPRMSVSGTAYWLTNETTQITESTQTIVQATASPKSVGAYTEISRRLLLQSNPGAEGIVSDDLSQIVATGADLACIAGAGASGEPDGIIGFSGVGSVTGTDLAYADILEFQTDVAASNVRPLRGGYVTTPAVASLCMQRQRFTSTDTPLWTGNIWDGQMAGFQAMSSNQVPAADMIFGDWNEMTLCEWGVLEIEVNPYANFQAGIIGVRAIYSMDVIHRRPFAFSIATSIT